MNELMGKIEFYAKIYEFSFQFWGRHNNNVFINKGGVELASFGGHVTLKSIVKEAIKYIERINPKLSDEYKAHVNNE